MIFNLLLVLSVVFVNSQYLAPNMPTISSISVDNYLGHWLQVYQAPTNVVFQGYGTCITADYGLLDNGYISVLNSQLDENKELEQISGYGYYKNISEPGKLTVHLEGVPVDSPYWIVKLGEVKDNQYQYTIITNPSGISLWVLTRNVDEFKKLYDKEVVDFLEQYNFKYEPVSQDGCSNNQLKISSNDQLKSSSNIQSQCQVANYLKKSGFPDYTIPTMVCISKYESSYNCDAVHKNQDSSSDYGLMQINSYYWCSGDPLSKYNSCGTSCSSLYNCQANTNCAYTIWKQQGYNAWYGYKNHKSECDNYKISC
jgi:lipocalin